MAVQEYKGPEKCELMTSKRRDQMLTRLLYDCLYRTNRTIQAKKATPTIAKIAYLSSLESDRAPKWEVLVDMIVFLAILQSGVTATGLGSFSMGRL